MEGKSASAPPPTAIRRGAVMIATIGGLPQPGLKAGKWRRLKSPKKLAPVIDLMAALKQSLAQMEGKKKPAATAKSDEPPAAVGGKSRRGR